MAAIDIYDPTVNNRALPGVIILFVILGFLASLLVTIRLYTRLWVKSTSGWDDWLIIPALIFAWGWFATTVVQIYGGGYGRHFETYNMRQVVVTDQTNLASNLTSATSRFCSRMSICFFLLRLVQRIRLWTYYLYGVIALNAVACLGWIIIFGIACVPISKLWKPDTPGWCMDPKSVDKSAKTFSSLSCVVDFMCALFPFFILRRSKIDVKTRVTLCILLGCGVLTAACSIGGAVALNFHAMDKSWDLVPLTYWTGAEVFGLIIVASLPATHQIAKHYREHNTFTRIQSNSNQSSSRLAGIKNKFTRRSTPTGSMERLKGHSGIKKTTDVSIELQESHSNPGTQTNYTQTTAQPLPVHVHDGTV